MTVSINSPIKGFKVIKENEVKAEVQPKVVSDAIEDRPEDVSGKTYKIKPGTLDHSLYVTINDFVDHNGKRRPIEIFVVSKCSESFQWVSALTRLISAIFRSTSDVEFLVKELREVFDPRGGYFIPKTGVYASSVVAHIGYVLEKHLQDIGASKKPQLDSHQQALVDAKKSEALGQTADNSKEVESASEIPGARLCGKCHTVSVIKLDGCDCCCNCGDSKCA